MKNAERFVTEAKKEQEKSVEKEIKLTKFRGAVEHYLDWQNSMLDNNKSILEVAKKRRGQVYDLNTYRTPDGQIWKVGANGYWPRGNREAKQEQLPEGAVRANSDYTDDWAWETLDAAGKTRDDFAQESRYADQAEKCVAFAKRLLNDWDKVEEWAKSRAEERDVFSHQHDIDEDWRTLVRTLGVDDKDLTDPTAMHIALTEAINELKTGRPSNLGIAY